MALAFLVTLARTSFSPGTFRYSFDSGQELSHALDIIEGRDYPKVGMSIGGQSLSVGPFVYYLMVPAVAVGRSAGAVAVWFGVLSGCASALLVWLGWRYLTPATGLLAGLIHALSATTMEWSVFVINAGALPVFSVLSLVAVTLAIERPLVWAPLAGVAIGLATQCHPATVTFVPMLPLGAWLAGRRLPWHAWLTYATGIAATYASWLEFESESGYGQIRSLLRIIGNRRYEGVRYVNSHSFANLLADTSHPAAIYRWGVLAGVIALAVAFAIGRRRAAQGEHPRLRALVGAGLASALVWVPFVGLVAARSASFDGPEYTRFFLPILPVVCLVAAAGWTAPWVVWRAAAWSPPERPALARWAPRAVQALAYGGVVVASVYALGWAGDPSWPFWVTPGYPPPDLSRDRQSLVFVKRLEARLLAQLGERWPDELAFVGTQNLIYPEEDQMALLAIEPLLRLEAMRRGARRAGASPEAPPFLTVMTGLSCERPPADPGPGSDPVERTRVQTFDDCPTFTSWLDQQRRACNVRGENTWVLQGNLRGSKGERPCARPLANSGYNLDTLEPAALLELASRPDAPLERVDRLRSLAERGPEAKVALPGLEALSHDAAPEVRIAALWAQARVAPADPGALAALTAALDDPEPVVRQAALFALGTLGKGGEAAARAIADRGADPDPAVREAAHWALAQVQPPPDPAP